MTMSKPLTLLMLTTTMLAFGCDAEEADGLGPLEFRDTGDLGGPDKLNTNFLGDDEDYPLDNLPLSPGGVIGVNVLEIRAHRCQDIGGTVVKGPPGSHPYSTLPINPNVEVDLGADGELGMLIVDDSGSNCYVYGEMWEDTLWEVSIQQAIGPDLVTDLRITDMSFDEYGRAVYEWEVNYGRLMQLPDWRSNPDYRPTCDEDLESIGLEYHAYLLPNLLVDIATGTFTYAAPGETMFLGCRSGAVGKAVQWGFSPQDHDLHETATRMVRADYCGTGESHTTVGTPIAVTTPELIPPVDHLVEAAWVEGGAAMCLTNRRDGNLASNIVCPNGGNPSALPTCDPNNLPLGAAIVTWIPDPAA